MLSAIWYGPDRPVALRDAPSAPRCPLYARGRCCGKGMPNLWRRRSRSWAPPSIPRNCPQITHTGGTFCGWPTMQKWPISTQSSSCSGNCCRSLSGTTSCCQTTCWPGAELLLRSPWRKRNAWMWPRAIPISTFSPCSRSSSEASGYRTSVSWNWARSAGRGS